MKAIETSYQGCRFRSRIEARWAVFFDSAYIEWQYEPEGYILQHAPEEEHKHFPPGKLIDDKEIYYLPDFKIPHLNCWIEIKGASPTIEERYKAYLLSIETNMNCFIFSGDIPYPTPDYQFYGDAEVFFAGGKGYDTDFMWCECPDCGLLGIEFEGRADRLNCKICYMCAQIASGKDVSVYAKIEKFPEIKEALLANKCYFHLDKQSKGCKRYGQSLDEGYNYNTVRLINAYTKARSMRFE